MEENMVSIIMGSKSDYPVVQRAERLLKAFEVEFETRILSAHRTPRLVEEFATGAEARGVEVIIAAAGKAAHLAGVVASNTPVPVIGLPIKSSTLDGLDSLLSTVQMPSGVPVATVAIDGAENAGLLAIQILSVKYENLRKELRTYKENMAKEIGRLDAEFQSDYQ
ncbi:5-(carboxyamino)imidazole ribonucleotide mutase [Clostridia bacterium]|nr:5-(carboxyamino)imidazole ribonucleotide mutase [Clostridia bacterium]